LAEDAEQGDARADRHPEEPRREAVDDERGDRAGARADDDADPDGVTYPDGVTKTTTGYLRQSG
jgi:hypothetical protein